MVLFIDIHFAPPGHITLILSKCPFLLLYLSCSDEPVGWRAVPTEMPLLLIKLLLSSLGWPLHRYGRDDADAECTDAPDHHAEYDAEVSAISGIHTACWIQLSPASAHTTGNDTVSKGHPYSCRTIVIVLWGLQGLHNASSAAQGVLQVSHAVLFSIMWGHNRRCQMHKCKLDSVQLLKCIWPTQLKY